MSAGALTLRGNAGRASAYLGPTILILAVMVGCPLVFTFAISFTSASFLGTLRELSFIGFGNYLEIAGSPQFQRAFFVTLKFVAFTVSLEMLLGLGAGLLLAEDFPGRTLLRVLLVIPWAIPTVVSAITWRLIYAPDFGVLNATLVQIGLIAEYRSWLGDPMLALYAIGIADIWKNFPVVALIVLAALQTAPQELYDAARVDGAGVLRRFTAVTFPHILGPLTVALVLRTIDTVKVFDIIWVMTRGGPFSSTKSMSMLVYERTFSNLQAGAGSAVAFIITMICLLFILAYVRLLRRETP